MSISATGTDYLASLGLSQPTVAKKRTELGQEDFLNLMITQFRNQDPFKPLDADAMLGQLAQFGTVAGLSAVRSQIEQLSGSLRSDQSLRATSLVGRNVLVPSSQVALGTSGDAIAGVTVPGDATQVTVRILDATGRLVGVVDLGPRGAGLTRFTWNGATVDGRRLPAGTYGLQAQAVIGGTSTALETLAGAAVSGVSLGGATGLIPLNLAGLGAFGLDAVREVYE